MIVAAFSGNKMLVLQQQKSNVTKFIFIRWQNRLINIKSHGCEVNLELASIIKAQQKYHCHGKYYQVKQMGKNQAVKQIDRLKEHQDGILLKIQK